MSPVVLTSLQASVPSDGVTVVSSDESVPKLRLAQLIVDALVQLLTVSSNEKVHMNQAVLFVLLYFQDLEKRKPKQKAWKKGEKELKAAVILLLSFVELDQLNLGDITQHQCASRGPDFIINKNSEFTNYRGNTHTGRTQRTQHNVLTVHQRSF